MRRLLWLLVLAALIVWPAGPAAAHGDDCVVAVHVGGIRIHPACG